MSLTIETDLDEKLHRQFRAFEDNVGLPEDLLARQYGALMHSGHESYAQKIVVMTDPNEPYHREVVDASARRISEQPGRVYGWLGGEIFLRSPRVEEAVFPYVEIPSLPEDDDENPADFDWYA